MFLTHWCHNFLTRDFRKVSSNSGRHNATGVAALWQDPASEGRSRGAVVSSTGNNSSPPREGGRGGGRGTGRVHAAEIPAATEPLGFTFTPLREDGGSSHEATPSLLPLPPFCSRSLPPPPSRPPEVARARPIMHRERGHARRPHQAAVRAPR